MCPSYTALLLSNNAWYVLSNGVLFPGLRALTVLTALLLCLVLHWGHCNLGESVQQHFEHQERNWHRQLREKIDNQVHLLKKRVAHSQPASSTTNPKDKEALIAFYNATKGDHWDNHTGWLKGDPCDDGWFGLYCVNGRVLQINLVYNGMRGTLPAKLAQADMLQVVRLYSNFISGTIPPEILQMKSLQILDLNSNAFTNTLPDAISMPNLTSLALYQNHIKGSIPSQWDTPLLEVLEISSNHFSGALPPSLSQLKALQHLVVSRNNLTGQFPSSYGDLVDLQQLWLFYNYFNRASIPENWAGMTSLQNVQMDGVFGMLPSFIGSSWTQLTDLVIVSGNLTGQFYTTFCNLQLVQSFRLFENQLTGTLPTCICEMKSLTDLELSDNQFTGSIPYCMGALSNLSTLYLSRNNLSGSLPTSIGDLSGLQILDVSSNLLTGSVPSSFAGLKTIVGFSLCYNKLYELEDGLEPLYDRIKDYSCELYSNPWSCPVPSDVPASCGAQCSQCNTDNKHTSCNICVSDSNCGWCNEGPNCLEGTSKGPDDIYRCYPQDWNYGSASSCP